MNVLVLGGAGFIGSHVVDLHIEKGDRVFVIDDLRGGKKEFVHPEARLDVVDLLTYSSTQFNNLYTNLGIERVYNYAAQPFIPDCIEKPLNAFDCNFMVGLNAIEAIKNSPVQRFLQVSSAEVYGNGARTNEYLKEGMSLEAPSTYAVSKVAIDQYITARHKEIGIPVITLRQFNCIGPRETHAYVVPEIIQQVHESPTIDDTNTIYLGSNTKRDFMPVELAAHNAIKLLDLGRFGEAYNLGSETSHFIYDIAITIHQLMEKGKNLSIIEDPSRVRPNDIDSLKSDNSKIKRLFGKELPKESIEYTLKRTIKYFRSNGNKW